MDGTSCGLLCQHPSCWNTGKIDMINAYRRKFGASLPEAVGVGQSVYPEALRETVRTGKSSTESLENDCAHDLLTGSLPTLKVVNLFAKDFGSDDDDSERDTLGCGAPFLPVSRETTFPLSSTREFGKSLKPPKAPCASPSPSFSSLYLKRLRRRSKKQFHQGQEELENVRENEETNKIMQATHVHFQDSQTQEISAKIPYLIWIPSKNKNKRKKCKSNDAQSLSQVPKVSMKNITGSNSDFGYLEAPYDQDKALRSYSRTTHISRSSPNRLYPRRLPPMSRDPSERIWSAKRHNNEPGASEMQLMGDGLLKDDKKSKKEARHFPATPKNTRASLRMLSGKIGKDVLKVVSNQKHLAEQENGSPSPEVLGIEMDGPFVIQNGKHLPELKRKDDCEENRTEMTSVKREELLLPRVTVPRDRLRQLPIENHCKNSIPSHQLRGIQMQPIEGTGATPSQTSSVSLSQRIISEDMKNIKDSLVAEVPLSDENYMRLLECEDLDGRVAQDLTENLMFHWEAVEEVVFAPAPTPSSPIRRTFEVLPPRDIDVISEKPFQTEDDHQQNVHLQELNVPEKHQQEMHQQGMHQHEMHQQGMHQQEMHQQEMHQQEVHQLEMHQQEMHQQKMHQQEVHQLEMHQLEMHQQKVHQQEVHQQRIQDTRQDKHEECDTLAIVPKNVFFEKEVSKSDSCTGSPIPSKASINDWPSDKDIMKQTYEKYRSFTPFKSPGVSLIETRVNLTREVNKRQHFDTRRVPSNIICNTGRSLPYPLLNGFEMMQRYAMLPRPQPTVMRSFKNSLFMQKQVNSCNISELNVSHMKPSQRKLKERHQGNLSPLRVGRMMLMDPSTRPKYDHIPSYEIYEALFKENDPNRDSDTNRDYDPNRDSDRVHIVIPVPNPTPCELTEMVSEDDLTVTNKNGTLMIINASSAFEKFKEIHDDEAELDVDLEVNDKVCYESVVNSDIESVSSQRETNLVQEDIEKAENQADTLMGIGYLGNIDDIDEIKDCENDKANSSNLLSELIVNENCGEEETAQLNVNIDKERKNGEIKSEEQIDTEPVILSEDFEAVSVPDLASALEMSLNLSEELKDAMLNSDDIDVNTENEKKS